MLDSLAGYNLKGFPDFSADRALLNKYNYPADYVPAFADSTYEARIEKLNRKSPFNFIYHPLVKQYIELYSVRKRALTEKILGLAHIYFPIFEEQLDKYNIPLELNTWQ